MDNLELISGLKKQLNDLPSQNEPKLDALRRRAEMIIRNVFGPTSKYLKDLNDIDFYPGVYPTTSERKREAWQEGVDQLLNLLNTMEEELKLFQLTVNKTSTQTQPRKSSRQIFIVHGHDEEMKQSVARTLSILEFDPIILHEKPNQGRTIIEKFTDYSEVSFAIVLLSPDDTARPRHSPPEDSKFRSRQNVILELGYFLGKLGRDRVVVIYRQEENFEMPSDYSGVLFVPFDSAGRWQFDLGKELRSCGYEVDANRLL
jgi:predicted nucleotide-binding protein